MSTRLVVELFASICPLTPRLGWAGGMLTTGAMAAAILSHMTWLGYSSRGDHGLRFAMAQAAFFSRFSVLVIHRRTIPFIKPLTA